MATFHILENLSIPADAKVPLIALRGRDSYGQVVAVKDGYCWLTLLTFMFLPIFTGPIAALFFLAWVINRKAWLAGLIAVISVTIFVPFLLYGGTFYDVPIVPDEYEHRTRWRISMLSVTSALGFVFALKASDWLVEGYEKRGYTKVASIDKPDIASKKDAIKAYLAKQA